MNDSWKDDDPANASDWPSESVVIGDWENDSFSSSSTFIEE